MFVESYQIKVFRTLRCVGMLKSFISIESLEVFPGGVGLNSFESCLKHKLLSATLTALKSVFDILFDVLNNFNRRNVII